MRHGFGAFGAALLFAIVALAAQPLTITFDDDVPGMPPSGFFFAAARQASIGRWEVQAASLRHHLAHLADPSAQGTSMAVPRAAAPANIRVTSRIRLVDGTRVGGIVWRYRDAGNFYAVGIGLQRHDATLLRVMSGNHVQLDHLSDLDVDPDAWHTLSVMHQGDRIIVHLDGIAILRAHDRGFEGGRAGVWSGGAAYTWFDDIRVDEVAEPRR